MLDTIEKALYWWSSFVLEGDSDAHCQLRAPVTDEIMMTVNDDLMSIIEVRGARQLVGPQEFAVMTQALSNKLASVMKSGNGRLHSFAVGFRSSPATASRAVRETLRPAIQTSRRYGITDEICFEDHIEAMAKRCSDQTAYLIFYTHMGGLSPSDRKRAANWREEAGSKFGKKAPGMRVNDAHTQNTRAPLPSLLTRHSAALENLETDLRDDLDKGGVGLLVQTLPVGQGLSFIRRHLDAADFPSSWRPRLVGDPNAFLSTMANRPREATDLLPMRIGRQMLTQSGVEIFEDAEMLKRGGTYYASVVLEVPPEMGSAPFSELATRIAHAIPWTINVEVVPNGESLRKVDQFYASLTGAFGDHNRRVAAGWRAVKELKRAGIYIAAFRVTFTTWADTQSEAVDYLSFLRSNIESWGSAVVTNETGSPGLATLCSAAGYAKRMPAPYIPVPSMALAEMLPVYDPASVWDNGQLIAHTKEGRVYPVGFGTGLQLYWGLAIFAPTGRGKSFLMNLINFGLLMSAGQEELPFLTIVDVGPSSRLVMDLVRALLPEHKRRQVVSLRIRNSDEFTVNPFDTQLGCDAPTDIDKDFQVAVVSTLCPTLGLEGEKFIAQVIDEAYRMFSRSSPQQRVWQNSYDAVVSKALEDIGFEVREKTRVWDVVDALFDAGRIEDASLAQRYAVPKLENLVKASKAKEILDNWSTAPTTTDELMLDVFSRNIATALTQYRLISGYTRFDIANARALSIDLEEVVTATASEEGKRRAALMFLFGRRLGARNYFLRWQEIEKLVPPRYKEYQLDRVAKIENSFKFLEYDEIHYATGIPQMAKRIEEDCRVGRKYNCVTMMASQLLKDFPKDALENCYSYFILGVGSDSSLEELRKTFGLTQSEADAVQKECVRPGRLLGRFNTVRGTTSQVLDVTAGGFVQWAFTTKKADALLRTAVTDAMQGDYLEALHILRDAFPSGSAEKEMDLYKRARGVDAESSSIVEVFTRKAIERAAQVSEEREAA